MPNVKNFISIPVVKQPGMILEALCSAIKLNWGDESKGVKLLRYPPQCPPGRIFILLSGFFQMVRCFYVMRFYAWLINVHLIEPL